MSILVVLYRPNKSCPGVLNKMTSRVIFVAPWLIKVWLTAWLGSSASCSIKASWAPTKAGHEWHFILLRVKVRRKKGQAHHSFPANTYFSRELQNQYLSSATKAKRRRKKDEANGELKNCFSMTKKFCSTLLQNSYNLPTLIIELSTMNIMLYHKDNKCRPILVQGLRRVFWNS